LRSGKTPASASSMPSVTQIAAALRRVEEEILRDHVAHCVEYAISSGDKADQRRKIAELMDVVSRADR
jgi:DNA-binding FrmR family transcriptional regulator